jgi:hypothetical protein
MTASCAFPRLEVKSFNKDSLHHIYTLLWELDCFLQLKFMTDFAPLRALSIHYTPNACRI